MYKTINKNNKTFLTPAIIMALLLIALFTFVGCGGSEDTASSDVDVETEEIITEEATTAESDPFEDLSMEEQNAYESAKSYLDYSGFSRKGLINQLKYEKYSEEACKTAVSLIEDNGEVDWKEECRECALSYLDYTSFSKGELIDQLKYEGFTDKQINAIIDDVYQ